MSIQLEKRTEILNNLLQIMHNSVSSHYEYIDYTFDYFKDDNDGSISIGEKFFFKKNGELKSVFLNYENKEVPNLIKELYPNKKHKLHNFKDDI